MRLRVITKQNKIRVTTSRGPQGKQGQQGEPGKDGKILSVVAGDNIIVDNTNDPNPIISADVGVKTINGNAPGSNGNIGVNAQDIGAEDVSNKSNDINLGNSSVLYPTQNAVKEYIGARLDELSNDLEIDINNKIDKDSLVINVKDHGALGDNNTDDTAAIQSAIDTARSIGNGASIYFPRGVYIVTRLNVQYGLKLFSMEYATIKQKAMTPQWYPILSTSNRLWTSSSPSPTEDSPPLVLQGLIIDGDQLNQGPYTGFEKQHNAGIHLHGASTGEWGRPRLRCVVDSCVFKNTCGDGIGVWYGVDLTVSNTFFWNCFRGSVVAIGGNTIVKATNITGGGSRHNSFFQAEIENNGRTQIYLTNSYFEHKSGAPEEGVGLDIITGQNSDISISNCYFGSGAHRLDGKDNTTIINISNCTFRQKDHDVLVQYGRTLMSGCRFIIPTTNTIGLRLRQFRSPSQTGPLSATFDGCLFETETDRIIERPALGNITSASITNNTITIELDTPHGLAAPGNYTNTLIWLSGVSPEAYNNRPYYMSGVPSPTSLALVSQENIGSISLSENPQAKSFTTGSALSFELAESNLHEITVQNCIFKQGFFRGIHMPQGGNLTAQNNIFGSSIAFGIKSGVNQYAIARLGNNIFNKSCGVYMDVEASGGASMADIEIRDRVPLRSSFIRRYININGLTVRGQRVVFSNSYPMTTQYKFPNDVYERANAPFGYATKYINSLHTYTSSDTWRVLESSTAQGTTANRPALTTQDVGVSYFDTTINSYIVWNGSTWQQMQSENIDGGTP